MNSNGSAIWQAYKKGAAFANPAFVQIHPTCIPVHGDFQSKLTLMSESLRNDGRIWVPKKKEDAEKIRNKQLRPEDIKEDDRDYFLERRYPAYGNLVPRDVASRAAKERCDAGYGVASTGFAVYLDLADSIKRLGKNVIEERYGNLIQMYQKIVDEDAYQTPMMIYPAIHYNMGGLWVDYELQTSVPNLFAIGECNFSDHGANRLGASALMQGLADGYFVLPYTFQNVCANEFRVKRLPTDLPEFEEAENKIREKLNKLMNIKGKKTVDTFHKQLGRIMWEHVGMGRTDKGLKDGIEKIKALRNEFWNDVKIPGAANELNVELEKAARVADYLELGELIARDALYRQESCGCHLREESQTPEGEAKRDDANFFYVGAWEYQGVDKEPVLNKEPLKYEFVEVKQRDYK
jgi:succinate dehydrogenase / fumarate reductase flavoprotein subunit